MNKKKISFMYSENFNVINRQIDPEKTPRPKNVFGVFPRDRYGKNGVISRTKRKISRSGKCEFTVYRDNL